MASRYCAAVLAVFVVGVFASAEDKPVLTKCFKLTGDTVDDIKLEFRHPFEPDLTTPEGAVAAWCAIADSRQEFESQELAALYLWDNATIKAVETYEKALLDRVAITAEKKNRDRIAEIRKRPRRGGYLPVKISNTTKLEDGRVVATGTQAERYEEDGEVEEYSTPVRYTLKKCEDGKWRIDVVETGWEEEGDDGETKLAWQNALGSLEFYYTYIGGTDALKDVPELKQDTPEKAALSLTGALSQHSRLLEVRFREKVMKPYVGAMESLCTAEWQKLLKGSAGVGSERPPIKPRIVESIRDGANGVKIVRFKSETEWNGPLDIHVVKVGEAWKVQGAYRVKLPKAEGGKEETSLLPSIYDAQWN